LELSNIKRTKEKPKKKATKEKRHFTVSRCTPKRVWGEKNVTNERNENGTNDCNKAQVGGGDKKIGKGVIIFQPIHTTGRGGGPNL